MHQSLQITQRTNDYIKEHKHWLILEGKFIKISITGSNSIGYAGIKEVKVSGSPSTEPQPMPDLYDDFESGGTSH
jgi:hypothetical protein